MSEMAISGIVFTCAFGGALGGMLLRKALPEHQLGTETKDAVKLAMGLVGTVAALVIGLLVATAKTQYDTQRGEFTRMSANIILLDRVLAMYGPETEDARELLRRLVAALLDEMETENGSPSTQSRPTAIEEVLYDEIQKLSPQNESQRDLKVQAIKIGADIGQTRWLLFEQQSESSIPKPFLVVLVFWLTIIHISFGLYAPSNTIVLTALFICALSVSTAIFLILELDRPFEGLIHFHTTPLRNALTILGH